MVDIISNIRILKQTFQAVSQIHAAGLIHRDLKVFYYLLLKINSIVEEGIVIVFAYIDVSNFFQPKNIFLSIGCHGQLEVKVGDFGLARFQDVSEPPTPAPGLCRGEISGGRKYKYYYIAIDFV